MAYFDVLRTRSSVRVSVGALLLALACACGGSSDAGDGGTGGDGGDTGPPGCLTQNFSGEPDVLVFPFIEARSQNPGLPVEFSVFVDGDTRLVRATLMDAWRLRSEAMGQSETIVENTLGNELLELTIGAPTRDGNNATGRYYVDLELCGASCDALRVVYTLNRENAGEGSDAINDPYERIVYENGVETDSSLTCDNPDSIAIQ